MAVTQALPNTRLSGVQTFNFDSFPAGTQWITLTLDRTVSGGLNSLTTTDTLQVAVDRSQDGGQTWVNAGGISCIGGLLVTKGVTRAQEQLSVGVDVSYTDYRVTTTASTPVRIAGQVDYAP